MHISGVFLTYSRHKGNKINVFVTEPYRGSADGRFGVSVVKNRSECKPPPFVGSAFRGVPSVPETLALGLLLLVEFWLFSRAFDKFFTHDSLFYMVNVPRSWDQLWQAFLAPSIEKNYRPVNLAFMAIFRPFLGVDPHPYHWIPLVFHLLNTLLFFILARKLFTGYAAALGATAFWGLHSVAGWVTYDITYLSDFLLAFLLLLSLLIAVHGSVKKSPWMTAASLSVFALALLTKESATTFPLAVWITLALADLRTIPEPVSWSRIRRSFRETLPVTLPYLIMAIAFAGLFLYWLQAGRLYSQGTHSAYRIDPWANLFSKFKYFYWAFNLPDALSIAGGAKYRLWTFWSMGGLLLVWAIDILRRRGRLTVIEWSGVLWFLGLNVPSFLLSSRLAKWYLYLPIFGLALSFGVVAGHLQALFSARLRRAAGILVPGILMIPIAFSSLYQTRSYLVASDSAYQSDLLQSCLRDFQNVHPVLPPRASLFFLPAFEEGVSDLLALPPIDRGQLFQMYYPDSTVHAQFAHKGDRLPADVGDRPDIIVLQYLGRHLYDVTPYFKHTGKMVLFLLPTPEGETAPLLKKKPAGGAELYQKFVQMQIADEGARLPDDYALRTDIWILQYLQGRFSDVTGYYKGRRRDGARRAVQGLEGIQYIVNRAEFYPDYENFGTPTGAPVFFSTPERDILTQIGGSTVTIPLGLIPAGSQLHFDVSWMFEQGDGAWAEAMLRTQGGEISAYREYMKPDPLRAELNWKEVQVDLRRFSGQEAELILKCTNDPGKFTVADWLNWRDITIGPAAGTPFRGK